MEVDSSQKYKPNPDGVTFLFSLNKQKVYPLKLKDKALNCNKSYGPIFGINGLGIDNNYADAYNWEDVKSKQSSFYDAEAVNGEFFGGLEFAADSYEVFRLE